MARHSPRYRISADEHGHVVLKFLDGSGDSRCFYATHTGYVFSDNDRQIRDCLERRGAPLQLDGHTLLDVIRREARNALAAADRAATRDIGHPIRADVWDVL